MRLNMRFLKVLPGLALAMLVTQHLPGSAQTKSRTAQVPSKGERSIPEMGRAEARLMQVYRQIAGGHSREALDMAAKVVRDYPNFQLAQLVYGDLLAARVRPVRALGDVPPEMAIAGAAALLELRAE